MRTREEILYMLSNKKYTDSVQRFIGQTFKKLNSDEDIFYYLCCCLSVPNAPYKRVFPIILKLRELDFFRKDVKNLRDLMKPARFYNVKSKNLREAKSKFQDILHVAKSNLSASFKREWLVKNVNGMGMKVASHFLRDLGHDDLAIIDTHIVKFMQCLPPSSNQHYLEIEQEFKKVAKSFEIPPAILDAIIWKEYSDTPWEEFFF